MLDLEGKAGQYIELAIGTAAIIIVGLIIIKLALKITRKALVKTTLDGAMYKFVLNVIKAVLGVVLIVVSLGYLKVPTAPLVTVLGAGGAAIALALKDSLGNIAGGIIILANKPFKKGDVIDVAGTSGIVESIDLFVTTLKTYDNKVISYDSDIAKAKDVLLAVADSCSDIMKEPPPVCGVSDHKESAIELELKVWCETSVYYDVKYYLEEQVKLSFDEANITIPYPQMDVRVIK